MKKGGLGNGNEITVTRIYKRPLAQDFQQAFYRDKHCIRTSIYDAYNRHFEVQKVSPKFSRGECCRLKTIDIRTYC